MDAQSSRINEKVGAMACQAVGYNQVTNDFLIEPVIMQMAAFDYGGFFDDSIKSSGTATGVQSVNTLQDTSKAWTVNEFAGMIVEITVGPGTKEIKWIVSNTSNTLTLSNNWGVTPVSGSSQYEISIKDRLTVPKGKGGLYLVSGKVSYLANAAGVRSTLIYKNNLTSIEASVIVNPVVAPFWTSLVLPSYYIELNEGEYVSLHTFQNSGAALSLADVVSSDVFISMARVG